MVLDEQNDRVENFTIIRTFQNVLVDIFEDGPRFPKGGFSRVDKKREDGFSACLVSTEERGPSILPIETTTLL